MPCNLTPDYLEAERRFKSARDYQERIEALEEMLRVIPKHKGTDHLRGDLKKRLSQLREDQRTAGKKGAKRHADPGHISRQGAGQVVMLGPSNVGKSSLVGALTRAEPEIADYPYTTRKPTPAMMFFEDVPIQLVDAPALERSVFQGWMNAIPRNADLALVVLDSAMIGVLGAVDELRELVSRGRVDMTPAWWALGEATSPMAASESEDLTGRELDDSELLARLEPGERELGTVVVVNKIDRPHSREEYEVLMELLDGEWPMMAVSAVTGEGLDQLRRAIFHGLRVMRVYAKPPGKPPSTGEPIILPIGSTVRDMARIIHKDIEAKLRFARIWSDRHFEGQRIPRDAVLADRDIVELNA